MAKKKTSTGALAAEVGAGIAAAAAAASAGYYFYASKDAKKNRKVAAKWASGLKKDVLKEAKRMGKDLDARSVAAAVDTALAAYRTAGSVSRADLVRAADELKRNWQLVQREALAARKTVKKAAKKAVKKASRGAKKAGKKVAKKARR
jgi:hypothetical protein